MIGQAGAQTPTLAGPTFTPVTRRSLQRCTATTECVECRKKRERTLKRAAINSSLVHDVPPIVHEVLRSPGELLDARTCAFMDPRFGHKSNKTFVYINMIIALNKQN